MIKILGIMVIAAFSSYILSELGFKGKKLFSVVALVFLFSAVSDLAGRMLSSVSPFFESAGLSDAAGAAVKIIGIGYLFGITSDIISELGEPMLARGLIAVGRLEIVVAVFPYLDNIIKLGLRLIG